MTLRRVSGVFMLLAVATGTPGLSSGQADPFWLRSWNAAQQSRPANMTASSRIASPAEPGTPLIVHGKIVEPDGRTPAANVVVHAYHRDRDGFDFGPGDRAMTTWRLQGWARTDAQGEFEFQTIRPAADHRGREGSHIHFTLESSEFGRQWAPTVYFADDPMVSEKTRRQSAEAGEFGWVRENTTLNDTQHIEVRIRLKARGEF